MPRRLQLPFLALAVTLTQSAQCPPEGFSTVKDFDLDSFVAKRWYIQEQMQVYAVPSHANFCIYAEYKRLSKSTFWGYDVQVHNYAGADAPPHKGHDSGGFLCAKVVDAKAGKLEVGPCFVPTWLAGPYWVLAYDEREGYALISGGAPSVSTPNGCRTSYGVNDAGLWVFTRAQARDDALVQKVEVIAAGKGFDLSVLNPINQTECGFASEQTSFVV